MRQINYSNLMGQKLTATLTLRENSQGLPQSFMKDIEKAFFTQVRLFYGSADCLIENGHRIKQWAIIDLFIQYASKDGISKAIGEISFPHLKYFYINQNNISSFEMISRLSAHNLQIIVMGGNKIVNISQMRKMQSKQIQKIMMRYNPLNGAECLTQGNWSALQCLTLPDSQINVCFCVKFQHKNNKKRYQLYIFDNRKRIAENKQIKSMIQKYFKTQDMSIQTKDERYTKEKQPK